MNWWIDEAIWPGPDESPLNLAPNPTVSVQRTPPVAPHPGDIWFDGCTANIYHYDTNTWKEVRA